MYKKLKQCKTLKEIYTILDGNWFEQVSAIILSIWILLPILISLVCIMSYFITPDYYSGSGWVLHYFMYQNLFEYLGVVTLVFWLFFLIGNLIIGKQKPYQRLREESWYLLLLCMLAWAFLSCLCSPNIKTAFLGNLFRFEGFESYLFYTAVMGCVLLIKSSERKRSLYILLIIVADFLAIGQFGTEHKWEFFCQIYQQPRSTVFYQFNHYGYLLNITIVTLAGLITYDHRPRYRLFYVASIILQIYTLIVNDTFGAYLGALIGLLGVCILFWIKKKRWDWFAIMPLLILVILSVISALGYIPSSADYNIGENFLILFGDVDKVAHHSESMGSAGTGRMGLWMAAFDAIKERPLLGYGPDSDVIAFTGTDRPHNEFIQHALFLGIPALIMYIAALVTLFLHQIKHLRKLNYTVLIAAGVVIGYLAGSMTGNTMFYTTYYFFMMLGFAAGREDDSPLLEKSDSVN